MSLTEIVVDGTLKRDGTLELDQKPNLPAGRVKVTLQASPPGALPQHGLANVIDEIRQGQQARGFKRRSAADIDAGRREGEAEYEQKMQELWSQAQSGQSTAGS